MAITIIRTEEDARNWLTENGLEVPVMTNGFVLESAACKRCGGSGFGPWIMDGGRCYDCRGIDTRTRVHRIPFKRWVQSLKAHLLRRDRIAEINRSRAHMAHERMLEGQRDWCEANGLGRITFEERDAARAAKEAARAATSKHVGIVGERREFTATIVGIPSWDNNYGTVHCHLMQDADGNTIVWKASGTYLRLDDIKAEKGDTVTFFATVKKHDMRNNVAQTVVTRACATAISKAKAAA